MKEQIYDEQIQPLVAQIIAICKEHKIALVADFALDDDMHCTTSLLADDYDPSDSQLRALEILHPPPSISFAETHTTAPDGSKQISIARIS